MCDLGPVIGGTEALWASIWVSSGYCNEYLGQAG